MTNVLSRDFLCPGRVSSKFERAGQIRFRPSMLKMVFRPEAIFSTPDLSFSDAEQSQEVLMR